MHLPERFRQVLDLPLRHFSDEGPTPSNEQNVAGRGLFGGSWPCSMGMGLGWGQEHPTNTCFTPLPCKVWRSLPGSRPQLLPHTCHPQAKGRGGAASRSEGGHWGQWRGSVAPHGWWRHGAGHQSCGAQTHTQG